jgi:hypothetical protein
MKAIHKLLAGTVDYAGLFPPANLSIKDTVANYAGYHGKPPRSMLGRLVVPTNRLDELKQAVNSFESEQISVDASPWRISALVPANPANDYQDFHQALDRIAEFNRTGSPSMGQALLVDSIEFKVNSAGELSTLAESCRADLDCYFEIDCLSDPTALIETLVRVSDMSVPQADSIASSTNRKRRFAKIRTGSVVASQIPTIEQVSRFIAACAHHFVPFKATAGLHHPIRNEYRLTYEPNADCGTMHGFLNVFVATLCAYEYQLDEQEIAKILQERAADNFHFEDDRIQWHHLTISLDRIDALRSQSIQSFGSCSFTEPTTELCELYQCQMF